MKVAVSFVVMILVLVLRPQGILGQARTAER
jgi:branched-subunit amino acid ABC-type transport system permease component